jgi:uncharacterized protein (TIGR00369 family)
VQPRGCVAWTGNPSVQAFKFTVPVPTLMGEAPFKLEELDDLLRIPPFHAYMGVTAAHASPGRCVLRVPPKEEFVGNPLVPAIHGGIISALIDLAGGAALFVDLKMPTPTVDMRVDFIRPAIAGRALSADARVKSLGRTVAFVDVDVHQPPGEAAEFPANADVDGARLVAQGRCVYSVKRPGTGPERAYPIG